MADQMFVYGNPLLDLMVDVDKPFLAKYGLEPNNAILAEDKHKGMYDELSKSANVEYVCGGAGQNSARVAQWMVGEPKVVTFTGCISKDKFGDTLREKALEVGLNVCYQYTTEAPTGSSACLISDGGKNRSLCAYLAAANLFSKDHLGKPEVAKLIDQSKLIYCASFPLTACPEAVHHLAMHASDNKKVFAMNLSAPFICQFFKEPLLKALLHTTLVFGNETEAALFAKENEFGTTNLKEVAVKIAQMPNVNGHERTVIITQGSLPSIVYRGGKIEEYPVIPIKEEVIIDTNGAGDAFVGGFLAGLIKKRDFVTCMNAANYAANFIIKQSGCSLPPVCDYSL